MSATLFAFVLGATTLFSSNIIASDAQEYTPIASSPYQVEAGDILRVSVWDEPELQAEVIVLPDLTISFPLVGVLPVNGMSVSEITETLTQSLSKFIPEAHVNVSLQQIRGSKFFVLGKVNRPGEFPLERATSVLQALSVAGGLATFADESGIKVIRGAGETQTAISISYPEILEGKSLDTNFAIESGDVVVVP